MDHLSASQVDALRQKLLAEKQVIESGLADRAAVLVMDEPIDGAEAAANESERRRLLLVSGHEKSRLAEVVAALQRIAQGVYGICEATDEEIPFARLQICPWTRYTAEGQAEVEAERAREGATFHEADPDEVY